jgi:hypothetical protein
VPPTPWTGAGRRALDDATLGHSRSLVAVASYAAGSDDGARDRTAISEQSDHIAGQAWNVDGRDPDALTER